MASLQRDINRLFEGTSGRQNGFGETRFPLMDVSESEKGIVIRALVPGLSKEDIKISLHQSVLSITGERKDPALPDKARVVRSERSSGRFQRTLRLRTPLQEAKVSAGVADGVLTLTLPLKEEARPRQIEVAVS
jgi:HSP20 family protein